MSIFIENPWPAILLGILGEAILAVILVRTGRGVLLVAMAGVLAASLLGVAVERWWSPTASSSRPCFTTPGTPWWPTT